MLHIDRDILVSTIARGRVHIEKFAKISTAYCKRIKLVNKIDQVLTLKLTFYVIAKHFSRYSCRCFVRGKREFQLTLLSSIKLELNLN